MIETELSGSVITCALRTEQVYGFSWVWPKDAFRSTCLLWDHRTHSEQKGVWGWGGPTGQMLFGFSSANYTRNGKMYFHFPHPRHSWEHRPRLCYF